MLCLRHLNVYDFQCLTNPVYCSAVFGSIGTAVVKGICVHSVLVSQHWHLPGYSTKYGRAFGAVSLTHEFKLRHGSYISVVPLCAHLTAPHYLSNQRSSHLLQLSHHADFREDSHWKDHHA